MKVIGITGGIGVGKTEVAKVFKKLGAIIVSADQIGKEVVEKNPKVIRKLVKVFGKETLTEGDKLKRRKLGELAFSSAKNRDRLNEIVHPHLLSSLREKIKEFRKRGKGILVVDAALIIEWGLQKELDYLILIESTLKNRLKRLVENQGYSKKEALLRISIQLEDKSRRGYEDYMIKNDRSLKDLKREVVLLWKKLTLKVIDKKG